MKFKTGAIAGLVLVVGVATYVIGGISHIGVGNVGFVKHPDGTVSEIGQGIHWTGWGVGVQEYTTYTQSLVLSDKNDEGGNKNQQWQVGTADQQELPVNTSLTWRVDITNATALYQAVGGQDINYIKNSIVEPTMKNIANRVTHDYSWNDIKGAKQGEVQDKINQLLKTELSKYGIIAGSFGFTYVGSPQGMEQSQQALATSELQTKQAQQAQDKAKIDNDTKILNAQADAQANEIEAQGIKAKADAMNELTIQEEAIQKWDGHLPQYNGGNTVPFINIGNTTAASK